jgi:hypothetical protein
MNRICGWKRGVATGVEIFANDSGALPFRDFLLAKGRERALSCQPAA